MGPVSQLLGLAWTCCVFLVTKATTLAPSTCQPPSNKPFVDSPGDVLLIGLFDLYDAGRCDVIRPGGVEEMHVAAWTVEQLNAGNYTGGVRIGFRGYDTCSTVHSALKQTIQTTVEAVYPLDGSCVEPEFVGFLGPANREISREVSSLLSSLDVFHLPVRMASLYAEAKALVAVLVQLKWQQVALLAANEALETEFHQVAAAFNICISASIVTPVRSEDESYVDVVRRVNASGTRVIVLLGSDVELTSALDLFRKQNLTGFYWLTAGTTTLAASRLDPITSAAQTLVLAQTTDSRFPNLTENLKARAVREISDAGYAQLMEKYLTAIGYCDRNATTPPPDGTVCRELGEYVVDPQTAATVEAVVGFADAVRYFSLSNCTGNATGCATWRDEVTSAFVAEVLKGRPQIEEMDVTLWSYQMRRRRRDKRRFVQVGHYSEGKLLLDMKGLNVLQAVGAGWFKVPQFQCSRGCTCINQSGLANGTEVTSAWKSDTWVTVCVTMTCIGLLVALALIVYTVVQLCRDETRRGSRGFVLLLLAGIVAAYCSVFPFAVADSPTTCTMRAVGVGLGYAVMLCPVIARCLMLATADAEGLPGHVSGVVQSALYFFMVSVQLAMAVQYCWLGVENEQSQICVPARGRLLCSLSYVMFLVVLWVAVSPFSARNRRNHREGLLFHMASLATLAVWVTWLVILFVLPVAWQDPVVCFSMVMNASVVMVTVFIPRVYKNATSEVTLDAAQVSLRPVGHVDAASLTNMTLKTLTTLYESVNHAYAPEPTGQAIKEVVSHAQEHHEERRESAPPKTTHL